MLDDPTTQSAAPADEPISDEPLEDGGATPSVEPLESLEEAAEAESAGQDEDIV